MKKKKQRTRWIFQRIGRKAGDRPTFVRCGIVRNINTKKHRPFDVIRLQFQSKTADGSFWLAPEEAIDWACGLISILMWWLSEYKPYEKWRTRKK